MREVFDFSNAKFHCSTIYNLIAPGKTLTPKQQYDQMLALYMEEMRKYEEMGERRQGMSRGLDKAAKITALEHKLKHLEPKKDEDPLCATAKSLLKRYYGFLKYGKWSAMLDKGNKYTNKGNLGEPDSIALVSFLDSALYSKNEEVFENDFLIGTPDIICDRDGEDYVMDVKTSWDWDTFSENIGKELNPLYYHQLMGYLLLRNAKKGEVSYCLVDTPAVIMEEEKFHLSKRMGAATTESPELRLAQAKLINNLTFSDIPAIERRIRFEVDYDEAVITKIREAVPKFRNYLFDIQEMHLTGKVSEKELINEEIID